MTDAVMVAEADAARPALPLDALMEAEHLRIIAPVTPGKWIVVFEPTTSAWWGRFLRPGFGHCYAIGFVPEEAGVPASWLYVEPLVTGTQVGVIAPWFVHAIFARAHMGLLKLLEIAPQGVLAVRPRLMVTCAGCVASVLGLRRYPLTPYGLFWTLRRLGAREIGR